MGLLACVYGKSKVQTDRWVAVEHATLSESDTHECEVGQEEVKESRARSLHIFAG